MKNQKYILALFIIVAILSISAVSAADDDSGSMISADDNQDLILEDIQEGVSTSTNDNDELFLEETINEDVLTSTNDELFLEENSNVPFAQQAIENEIIYEPNNGSRIALRNKINNATEGSTIILENNYTFDDWGAISIKKALTIDGAGHTIDGNGELVFYIDYNSEVTIKNLEFINCEGPIKNFGELTIINTIFANNVGQDGGAIQNYCELTIINTTFEYNRAYTPNNVYGYGGAILNEGTLSISNSTFNNNEGFDGGAILNRGTLTISNTTFANNKANCTVNFDSHTSRGDGGAIRNEGTLSISNSTFENNTALNAGAILNNGKVTLKNSFLINNTAINAGAIYNNRYDEFIIINSSLIDNKATGIAGAIYNHYNTLTLINSTLTNNSAESSGGAIYNYYSNLTLIDSTFTSNSAALNGGAIYTIQLNSDFQVAINNNTFTNNTANNGSAIYVSGEEIDVSNNIYNNNDYTIDTRDSIIINVTGNTFEDIQNAIDMAYDGDTISLKDQTYIGSGSQILVDKSLTIIGNNAVLDAQNLSAIFNITKNVFNITFKDIKFTHGCGEFFVGVVNSESSNTNIINCSFSDNSEYFIVRISNIDSNVVIVNSVFENNLGNLLCALYISSNNALIDNCIFNNNFDNTDWAAMGYEGISLWCNANNINLTNSIVSNSSTYDDSNAVSLNGGNITVFNCTFDNNTSNIYLSERERPLSNPRLWGDTYFNISNCTFKNNYGENLIKYYFDDYRLDFPYRNGIIIFMDNIFENNICSINVSSNYTLMKNCSFINCDTPINVGNNNFKNHTVEVYDCSFVESNAPIRGLLVKDFKVYNCSFDKCAAAISFVNYLSTNSTLTVLDCNFTNGTGDAIYLEKVDNFIINNCNFTAGGMGIWGADVENFILDICNFINNSAGGIYLLNGVDSNFTSITNCNFENNSIYEGYEIFLGYRSNSNATLIKNCSFLKNSVYDEFGRAVYLFGMNNFEIKDCKFENNSAYRGSAIYCEQSNNGSMTNCSFINNFVYVECAINFETSNSIIANCTFINNTGDADSAGVFSGENNIIVNCSFINNSAKYFEDSLGTYAFEFGGTNCLMANCTFENNTAESLGGALRLFGINSTVENCSFKNNHVESDGGTAQAGAMTISFTSSATGIDLVVKNCNFTNNYVKNKNGTSLGGAMLLGSGTVLNCNFINNSAIGNNSGGGAIACFRRNSDTAIINCLFENNSAGGGFADRFVIDDIGGGAIFYQAYKQDAFNIIANSTFINNKVFSRYLNVTNSLSAMTISLEGYEEYFNAIYTSGQYKDTMTISFSNLSYWDGEMLNTDDVPIIRSYMARNQPIVLEIYDSMGNLFKNITLITDSNGEVSLDYMDLPDGNYSYVTYHPDTDYYGYIMADPGEFIVKSSFEILQSLIDDATDNVTLKKDFTYSDSDLSELIINKTLTIYGNGHSIDANNMARIFNVSEGVTLTLVNVTLKNGQSDCGGAIFNNGTLVLIDSMLLNNNATNGGAIYNNPDCNVNLTNSVLANNTASYGGAIYSENGTISIINSTLSDNYAAWGAVFYSENGKISITDSLIDKNTASSFGVIYSKNDTVTMTNSTFSNNQGRRGGIDVEGSNWTISDSNFIANHAEIGGALENWGVTTIISSVLKDNTATQGNAIFAHNNNLTLDDVTFVDNGDSAIYCSDGVEVDTSNCKFLTGTEFEIENIPDFVNGTPITITVRETRNGESFNGNVTVSIGNYSYEIEVKNGTGSITVTPDLIFGKYTVKLSYNETETYFSSNAESSQFQVSNNPSIKIGNIANFVTGSNVTISVTAVDTFNGAVNVRIGGVDYEVDLINGSGSRTIALNLKGGSYKATINFAGNENFTAENVTGNTFTVTKKATAITASAVTATYNVNKYLALTLKDKTGKAISGVKVTIKLNGKTYTKTTDKNGQVKLGVASLIPKTYTATITFAGNDIYEKSSKNVKVVVKKATPKMTAKAKTFRVKVKVKKYAITLKTNKNKVMKNTKVTLKINKKTFTAKTNKKGVATFKITNLKKKGKFTAVIKYAGSKYYNKLTKKAKITVKK